MNLQARRVEWNKKSQEQKTADLKQEKLFWTDQLKKAHETLSLPYKRYDNQKGGVIKLKVDLAVKMNQLITFLTRHEKP